MNHLIGLAIFAAIVTGSASGLMADDWQQKKADILQNVREGVPSSGSSSSSRKWTVEGDRLKMEIKQINELKKQPGSADGYGTAGNYGSTDGYGTARSYGTVDGYYGN